MDRKFDFLVTEPKFVRQTLSTDSTEPRNFLLLLFSMLSDDRSKASSKTIPPHSAIQSLLFQMSILSCP